PSASGPLESDPEAIEPIAPNPSASGPLESYPEAIEPVASNPSASGPLAPDPEAIELGKERLAEGVRLAEAGLFAEAIQAFDDIIAHDPGVALAWRYKGMANLAQGMDDEAISCLERSLKIDQADGVAWYSLGVALHNMGRHEEALDAYDRAGAIPGGWPKEEILTGRGMALGELGHYDEALASFEAALAIDPSLTEAQYGKGYALLALGREAEGEEALLLAEEIEAAEGLTAR
ncbi:MAG: tetratricopeptide repeat protein, partial [Methanotrichaceae archaeon]|nr:tetratricopeptide repeat protein [Methanotrichaceae archaeon]